MRNAALVCEKRLFKNRKKLPFKLQVGEDVRGGFPTVNDRLNQRGGINISKMRKTNTATTLDCRAKCMLH